MAKQRLAWARKGRLPGLVSGLHLLAAGQVWGQIEDQEAIEEQVLPTTVVTATRIETPIEQVGSAVTLITAEDLARRQVRVVADVLRDVPGVAVNRSGVIGNQTEIRIRGAEPNQSLVVIDGVRVNNPSGEGFDFGSLLDLDIERIEVLRGPASVLWGSDAVGGVVNIVTKQAEQPLQAAIRAEGGSFATGQVLGSLGSRGDGYHVRAAGTYFETSGISSGARSRGNNERDGARIGSFNLTAGLEPTDNLELDLVGGYSEDTSDFDDFVGGLERPVVDADQVADRTQYRLRAQVKLTLLEGAWEHILSAGRYDIDTEIRTDGTTSFASEGQTDEAYYQTNFFFKTPGLGGAAHGVTLLADYQEDRSENDFFLERSIRSNAYALNYNAGFFDKLFLSAGIRHDDNSRFDDTETYRLSAAYLLRDWGTRFHASYGKAVKNPTLTELFGFSGDFQGNPNLQPETGFGWDIGVEQAFADERIEVDLTYFDSRVEDLIIGAGRTVENLDGESKARGLELSARARITDALGLVATYTYTDSEDADGEQLVRRPRNLASLILDYGFLDGRANANLRVRYNGSQQDLAFDSLTFATTQVELDAFTLVDLAGTYRIDDRFSLVGRIENLFDEEYEEVFGYGSLERGFYLGLQASL